MPVRSTSTRSSRRSRACCRPGARLPRPGTPALPEMVAVLGSVLDAALVRQTIDKYGTETIYHAAAYKHVPIVEHNAVAGLRNNTFGTAVLAEAAERGGVERFVLVSTDKAVRPTSIMGASKRLAEMVLQARAASGGGRTVFTMVRFGNVLDSSGSVVRRFRGQIEAGGPVTVTHRDVIRYFMSIPEAAALVIQAGAMATGGDVFVLDMGEPVKIDDLARSMIRLMGLEVRDAEHADGDIAIEYIGLRHGEKLHEELLLGENVAQTDHPRILKSQEPCLAAAELAKRAGCPARRHGSRRCPGDPCRAHPGRGGLSPGDAPPHAERDLGRAVGACRRRWALNERAGPLGRGTQAPAAAGDGGVDPGRRHSLSGAAATGAGRAASERRGPPCLATDGRVRAAVAPALCADRRPRAGRRLSLHQRHLVAQPLVGARLAGHAVPVHRRSAFDAAGAGRRRCRRSARDGPRSLRGDGAGRCGALHRGAQRTMAAQAADDVCACASARTCGTSESRTGR